MTKTAQERGEVDHLLFLLSNDLRRELLSEFASRAMSAAEVARAIGKPRALVSYHAREMYADGRGLLRKVKEKKVRGAAEVFYTLKMWGERTTLRSGRHSPVVAAQLQMIEVLIESIAGGARVDIPTTCIGGVAELDEKRREHLEGTVLGPAQKEILASAADSEERGASGEGEGTSPFVLSVVLMPAARWDEEDA